MSHQGGFEPSEPPHKKICTTPAVEDGGDSSSSQCAQDLSMTRSSEENGVPVAADFSQLQVVRVLSNMDSNCSVAFEARHRSEEGRVLIHMQKTPFDTEHLGDIVSGRTNLTQLFHNDVYSKHTATLPPDLNRVQVTLVHPAQDKHFQRYERELSSLVQETPHLYQTLTKPFVESGAAHSKQWIYNILEGTSEADRVVCRDDHPDTGFVVVPDMKWTGEQLTDLYCQALVMRRDLTSIRDLSGDHLPLLMNIRDKATNAITAKYGVSSDRLRAYFHYLPSFYHLHVHFAALTFDAPGTWCGKAHLLSDVISNLEQDPLHYRKASISFTVKDNHPHPLARHNRDKREQSLASAERGSVVRGVDDLAKSKEEKDRLNMKRKADQE